MKIGVVLFVAFTLEAYGIERTVFQDQFPTVQSYQMTTLGQVKNYLETLFSKSVLVVDDKDIFIFRVKNENEIVISEINCRILRKVSSSKVEETVIYSLPNGQSFIYEVLKSGEKAQVSSDYDLLLMRFKPSLHDLFYNVKIPYFGFELSVEKSVNKEVSYILLRDVELNLKIETTFSDKYAYQHYLYFFKYMPSPQTSLTVKAELNNADWGGVNYSYSNSSLGVISPKIFFQELAQASYFYSEIATGYRQMLFGLGFPDLDN